MSVPSPVKISQLNRAWSTAESSVIAGKLTSREKVWDCCQVMPHAELLDLKMNRKGFGLRAEVRQEVDSAYQSDIIDDIKASGFSKTFGRLTIHLAREFGFCYGVDRAVELAYETRRYYPHKRIFLTTEIIHNPSVNRTLLDMDVRFLAGRYKNADREEVTGNDVVIVPAFGATVAELSSLRDIGCMLVDTICGSVVNVWKRVERYAQEGYTSVIHGKYNHEETQATSSRVTMFPDAHYLVVLDEAEALCACDYIVHGGDKTAFMQKFGNSVSLGFDPDAHLSRLGFANQTTMLSSESIRIAEMFRKALKERFGGDDFNKRYLAFDTICSATQERQDAIIALEDKKPDRIIVIGGYNSSNTTHLKEIAERFAPSYHIDGPHCIVDDATIRHKPLGGKTEVETKSWLPEGEVAVGITAGASTPNRVMGEVMERMISFG